jgi:uncharacterized membrane protein
LTDDRMEQIIGTLLRAGVILSAAVVLAGGVWYLARHGESRPHYQTFAAEPWGLGALAGLAHPRPRTIIQTGLLLLIATPVARVLFSLAAFALERDRTYVLVTLLVLAVLLYGLAS